MKIIFRVRRQYFDQIAKEEKTIEFRAGSPYWDSRMRSVINISKLGFPGRWIPYERVEAVFVCGHSKCIRQVHSITREPPSNIEVLMGRRPSDQGAKDLHLDKVDHVWAIWLA